MAAAEMSIAESAIASPTVPDAVSPSVAYVTQWFPPETSTVPLWIARSLRKRGLDLKVITGVPNYPAGKVYPGYTAWRRVTERIEGFPVLRSPLYPSHGTSALGRVTNLVSYAFSSAVFGKRWLKSADVALVFSSPATAATAAIRAKRRWGTPYVLLILDLWPDSVFASGFLDRGVIGKAASRALTWFTKLSYAAASHVAVTTPGMRETLIERGVPPEKLSIIYNWADEATMRPEAPHPGLRESLGLRNSFVLMYGGNHGSAQALDTLIQAMAELADQPDIHLVMVGDGFEKPRLRMLSESLGLRTVHFLDSVDSSDMPALMAAADVQLVSLADRELFRITIPSKVQSIMACAQPIILCGDGDAARLVRDSGAGIVCSPENPSELANAVRLARSMPLSDLAAMGAAGRHFYTSQMSEEISSFALASLLRKAAQEGGSRLVGGRK